MDFSKGLNFVDPALGMAPEYVTIGRNIELGYDTTVKKRNGFKMVANLWDKMREGEKIQEIFFFSSYCFCYTNVGRILSVDELGNVGIEWDELEAALQSTTELVEIWSNPDKRCFGTAAGDLFVISNGYDKPLQIRFSTDTRVMLEGTITVTGDNIECTDASDFGAGNNIGFMVDDVVYAGSIDSISGNVITVGTWYTDAPDDGEYQVTLVSGAGIINYLHDPATGSNANTPRIYKCIMANHYLCAICRSEFDGATDTGVPDTHVYFSAKDAPGVWEGDEDWKDSGGADAIDVSQLIKMEEQKLVDIDCIRGEVCIFTNYGFVLYKLDTYKQVGSTEETVTEQGESTQVVTMREEHVPTLDTIVENAGALCVGSVQSIYDSMAFLSANGINSVKRNVVSMNFIPDSLSSKVLPYITVRINEELIENGVVSLVDYRKFVYGLKFEDNTMLMMSFHPNLMDRKSFFIWDNIRYVSFANNQYGKILATDGYGVMVYTDDEERIHQDTYIDDEGVPHAENFEMEFQTAWLAYQASLNVKTMEYANVVCDGTAEFQLSASFDLQNDDEVYVDMVGGDAQGYGSGSTLLGIVSGSSVIYNGREVGTIEGNKVYKNGLVVRELDSVYDGEAVYYQNENRLYGGGIIASNLNLIEFSHTFMYNRFKIYSVDDKPLRIVRIGVNYKVGGIRR